MDRHAIITTPHPSLRQRSRRVSHVDDTIRSIINDMKSATIDWEKYRKHELGVALAAVQINHLVKVIIIRSTEDKDDKRFDVLINPEVVKVSDDTTLDYEGCLSVPDIYGLIPRANKIKVRALDPDGHEVRINAEGFMARILQHEIDHLNGKLIIDRIKGETESFFRLDAQGELQPLNYEKDVKNNHILWQ